MNRNEASSPTSAAITFRWVEGSKLLLAGWLLLIVAEVLSGISLLRNFPDQLSVRVALFALLGLTFFGGLLLALRWCEVVLKDDRLLILCRSVLRLLLRAPANHRLISSVDIMNFRLAKNLWNETSLEIVLKDGIALRIRKPSPRAGDGGTQFERFVAAFEVFAAGSAADSFDS